jgi:hypothetical protein
MSRSLGLLLVLTAAVVGCASSPPAQVVQSPTPTVIPDPVLQRWLTQEAAVKSKTTEQINTELATMGKPDTVDGLFYVALLNQQSQAYSGWTQARDIFRQLSQDTQLAPQYRQLAAILEEYNQSRINWHQRYIDLQQENKLLLQQLDDTAQEKLLLEQKIQAVTDLEAEISTRKEP